MANKKTVLELIGKYHKYWVVRHPGGVFCSPTFSVIRDDGKSWGSYSSPDRAAQVAKEKAGPGAYERS